MKSIGYYPGCSLSGTAFEYDRSLRAVAARMGVELKEIPQWVCCGATSAHAIDHDAALCLAADTLAKARRAGLSDVLAPCAMCYQRLAVAVHEMGRNPQLCARVAQALGESPDIGLHRVRPLSLLNWLEQIDQEQMRSLVSSPLNGLKVACYYGCLLVRPPKITGVKEVESPRGMEKTVRVLGAQPVRWSMAMECCGASFAISRKGVVLRQGKRVYDAARKAGADVICLACPMCHSNLDLRQRQFNGDSDPPIPVLYLTQLLGLAFGLSGDELALKGHFVPVQDTLRRCLTTPSPGTPGEGRGEGHLQNQTLTPTLSQGTGRGGKT